MTEDPRTALEQEQEDRMTDDEIESRIIALFEQLSFRRQEAVLDLLQTELDNDLDDDEDDEDDE